MPHETEILANESGIQYQGVNDASSVTGDYPIQGLMTGIFKRGRFDRPMTIHKSNIKAMLGHEPKNPYYNAVQDALETGVPSVQVLRIGLKSILPPIPEPEPEPEPEPTDRFVISCTPPDGQQKVVLHKVRDTLPFLTFFNVSFNVYFNGVLVATEISLSDAESTANIGLEVEFLGSGYRDISITNISDTQKAIELYPTLGIIDDIDIDPTSVAILQSNSVHFCLAPKSIDGPLFNCTLVDTYEVNQTTEKSLPGAYRLGSYTHSAPMSAFIVNGKRYPISMVGYSTWMEAATEAYKASEELMGLISFYARDSYGEIIFKLLNKTNQSMTAGLYPDPDDSLKVYFCWILTAMP